MASRERVIEDALSLSEEDREEVIRILWKSLGDELEAAWADEVDRRIEAHERGESQAVPWDVALASIRRDLERLRREREERETVN